VTELTSCAEFHFNNIGSFIVRPVIFAYLRAHVLPRNVKLTSNKPKYLPWKL
jgi:hypothetical protein